jgi:hypothetical protein
MADESDQADVTIALFLNAAMQKMTVKRFSETHNATGLCWNCLEPTGKDNRFCDDDCKLDYDKRKSRR